MAARDGVQANTVCMVWCITAVAKEKNFFVVGVVTDRAGPHFVLFFGVFVEPCLRVELGNLLFVFDLVGGEQGTLALMISLILRRTCKQTLTRGATHLQLYRRRVPNERPGDKWDNYWLFPSILSNRHHGGYGRRLG